MNKYSLKILKRLARCRDIKSTKYLEDAFNRLNIHHYLEDLEKNGLIEHLIIQDDVDTEIETSMDFWILTIKGMDFLSDKKESNIHFWLPIIISNFFTLLALVLSIISLLMQQ